MTITTPHQPYLLIYKLLHCSSEEYCDCSIRVFRSDCSIRVYRSFKQALHGASWGPFQAGARGKMPQLPPPVGGPADKQNPRCIFISLTWPDHFFLVKHLSIALYRIAWNSWPGRLFLSSNFQSDPVAWVKSYFSEIPYREKVLMGESFKVESK